MLFMAQRSAWIWCRALGKRVRVILTEVGPDAEEEDAVPKGWGVRRCLDKGLNCAGKECPFRMVFGGGPRGQDGERR